MEVTKPSEEQILVEKVISIVSNRITLILGDVIRNKGGNFTDVDKELKECIELISTLNELRNNGYTTKFIVVNNNYDEYYNELLNKVFGKKNNDEQ